MYRVRGVSELTSAALLALIVLVVGGFVVSHILSILEYGYSETQNRILGISQEIEKTLTVMAAYKPADSIVRVVLASGGYPVRLDAVYVNEILWTDACTVDGSPVKGFVVGPDSIVVLECTSTPSGTVSVKVAYDGGDVVALAG